MELAYCLNNEDYLTHQLYTASKSDRIKKQRLKNRLLVTLIFICLSYIFFARGDNFMMYYFAGLSIITFIFYPYYQKRIYYKHYQKYVNETYKNRINEICHTVFDETSIVCKDISGESKINLSSIEEIIEIGDYIYLKIKTGGYFILPKLKVENISEVQIHLASLAKRLKINYTKELVWKWK